MGNLKRLAAKVDNVLVVKSPVEDDEIELRKIDYPILPPVKFANKYNRLLFESIEIASKQGISFIQINHCTNPYCKWFGLPQERFVSIKNKPSRYKLDGTISDHKSIVCNPDPIGQRDVHTTLNCKSRALSNWSLGQEIERLTRINTVLDLTPEYQYHKENCSLEEFTPFENPEWFYKQGKSQSNSQRWQCKKCKKKTNVLPKQRESFSYHQKRNDILHDLAKLLLSRSPVKRTCEILEIGNQTYYSKLEWLYRRCIEFLERHETNGFRNLKLDSLWINTDKLLYNLNNVRRKGMGGKYYDDVEDKQLQTHIVVSGEESSRYILRCDVAYDWDTTLSDIKKDTLIYKDDHLVEFSQKNGHLRFSFSPQKPTEFDYQTSTEYAKALNEFERREKYIDGLHVNSTYTTMAHYWLIKNQIKTDRWRFITDNDQSLRTAIYRVFSKDIRLSNAHHFICQIDNSKRRAEAFSEFQEAKKQLIEWGNLKGYDTKNTRLLGYLKLREELQTHKFYKEKLYNDKSYRVYAKNPIKHPFPFIDEGTRMVDCTTDVFSIEVEHLANMILKVNNRTVNTFMQQIRRRLSILERPLVTARGDGKSYIYSNCNPKYAQYALTILRTYYNFCLAYKAGKGEKLTPAQRIGLTDRQYTLRDIIYFR